jgi:hypothetical protein
MADLENIINELPNLADNLKLNFSNSTNIQKEFIRIENIQAKLQEAQDAIQAELDWEQLKNKAMGALPFVGTVASLFIPGGFVVDALIAGGAELFAEKFGNPEHELTLNDLLTLTEDWLDWGSWLQEIAEKILNDSEYGKKITHHNNLTNLSLQFESIQRNLIIQLEFNDEQIIKQQIKNLNDSQKLLLQLQPFIDYVTNQIKFKNDDILELLLGVSAFFGQSGFALEWLNDEDGLIISSQKQFYSLSDVFITCESLKEEVNTLILQSNNLRGQAEQALKNLEAQKREFNSSPPNTVRNEAVVTEPKSYVRYNSLKSNNQASHKTGRSILVIIVSAIVLSFTAWVTKDQLLPAQQISSSLNQEGSVVANLQSAEKLGMEAAVIVQNPPHPLTVWEQAEAKWQQAINLLESIPQGTSVSSQANQRLATYRVNRDVISKRLVVEQKAKADLEAAQNLAMEAAVMVQNPPHPPIVWQQAQVKWQQAINLLESIPDNTFVSQKVKEKLSTYKTNYAAISARLRN